MLFSKLEEKFFGFIVRLSGKLAVQVNRSVDNEVLGHYSEHIGQINKLGGDVSVRDFEGEIEYSKDFRKKMLMLLFLALCLGFLLLCPLWLCLFLLLHAPSQLFCFLWRNMSNAAVVGILKSR